MQFRKLILENSDRYNHGNRKEKSGIISSIFTQITSGYGGRFLEASDTKSGSSEESYRESWREVDQFEAKKKISQSLRDEKKRQQRSTNETSEDDSTLPRRRKRPRLKDSREQSSMQTMTRTRTNSSSSQGEQTFSSTPPVLPSNVSAPPLHATAAAAAPLLTTTFLCRRFLLLQYLMHFRECLQIIRVQWVATISKIFCHGLCIRPSIIFTYLVPLFNLATLQRFQILQEHQDQVQQVVTHATHKWKLYPCLTCQLQIHCKQENNLFRNSDEITQLFLM